MSQHSVLFVDDQPSVLHGLRRTLWPHRREWEMFFASSAAEALQILEAHPLEVIITDMRMPGVDGAQLLEMVRQRHPDVVRIVLSGYSASETILQSVGAAHQYLSKPCSAENLEVTIRRAFLVKQLLEVNPSLQALVGRIQTLPALPSLYLRITRELQAEEPSLKTIGAVVSQDPGMAAKMLQLVNSAFFALPRRVEDPAQAVTLLGIEVTKALVLSLEIFSQHERLSIGGVSLERLWQHSTRCALLTRRLAEAEHATSGGIQDRAYTTGLLHDIGKLILGAMLPSEYRKVGRNAADQSIPTFAAERERWGTEHAAVGAFLLGLWGLPEDLVQAVRWHHEPRETENEAWADLTLLVHVSNALVDECGHSSGTPVSFLDEEYIRSIGKSTSLPQWREIASKALTPVRTDPTTTRGRNFARRVRASAREGGAK
ncbi:MAG: response regulator [Acidobacteriota bacterium]